MEHDNYSQTTIKLPINVDLMKWSGHGGSRSRTIRSSDGVWQSNRWCRCQSITPSRLLTTVPGCLFFATTIQGSGSIDKKNFYF